MTDFDPKAYSEATNAFAPSSETSFLLEDPLDPSVTLFSPSRGPQMMPILSDVSMENEAAALDQSALRLKENLVDLRESPDPMQTFEAAFGDNWEPAEAGPLVAELIDKGILDEGGRGPAIRDVDEDDFPGGIGDDRSFLSDMVLAAGIQNPKVLDDVQLETVGPYFAPSADLSGDEESILTRLPQGQTMSDSELQGGKNEDDHYSTDLSRSLLLPGMELFLGNQQSIVATSPFELDAQAAGLEAEPIDLTAPIEGRIPSTNGESIPFYLNRDALTDFYLEDEDSVATNIESLPIFASETSSAESLLDEIPPGSMGGVLVESYARMKLLYEKTIPLLRQSLEDEVVDQLTELMNPWALPLIVASFTPPGRLLSMGLQIQEYAEAMRAGSDALAFIYHDVSVVRKPLDVVAQNFSDAIAFITVEALIGASTKNAGAAGTGLLSKGDVSTKKTDRTIDEVLEQDSLPSLPRSKDRVMEALPSVRLPLSGNSANSSKNNLDFQQTRNTDNEGFDGALDSRNLQKNVSSATRDIPSKSSLNTEIPNDLEQPNSGTQSVSKPFPNSAGTQDLTPNVLDAKTILPDGTPLQLAALQEFLNNHSELGDAQENLKQRDILELVEALGHQSEPSPNNLRRPLTHLTNEIDPPPSTKIIRRTPGTAFGAEKLPPGNGGKLLPNGRVGLIPRSIGYKLQGRKFKSPDHFREEFWRLIAKDEIYGKGWSKINEERMKDGKAPIAKGPEQTGRGSNSVLQLDHSHDLQYGGDPYDMEAIRIVTPLFHAESGKMPD